MEIVSQKVYTEKELRDIIENHTIFTCPHCSTKFKISRNDYEVLPIMWTFWLLSFHCPGCHAKLESKQYTTIPSNEIRRREKESRNKEHPAKKWWKLWQ